MRPKLAFIGAGKVGQTLTRSLYKKGYAITAISSRSRQPAQALSVIVEADLVENPQDVVPNADLIFLTVNDDAIAPIVALLQNEEWENKGIIHTSGAISTDSLKPLEENGAMIGSLHPAFPFADVEVAISQLMGATFATEASHPTLQGWLTTIIQALQGHEIRIPSGKKALYHAALTIASNYTVTLYATAQTLLHQLGADNEAISAALDTLVGATVDNITSLGIPDALTGALVRSDLETIKSHLRAIDDMQLRQAYIILARLTYPMLNQRGVDTVSIEQAIQEII